MKVLLLIFILTFSGCRSNVTKNPPAESVKKENKQETAASTPAVTGNPDSTVNSGDGAVEYNVRNIPSQIKCPGKIVESVKWKDDLGSNLVLICETDEKWNGDLRSKELNAYHYIVDGDNVNQLWKIYDYINDCPVDITLSYIDNSFSVTDLDKNGIFETSFLYRLSCKGDVSADNMKLIMHEGEKKFAIRGSMKLIVKGEQYEKGTMIPDPSFNTAPDKFLEFATGQWNKFETEKLGE